MFGVTLKPIVVCCFSLFIPYIFSDLAHAQSTSGVTGPVIKEGEESLEYRISIDPSSEDQSSLAHRLHYQKAINDNLRWRAIVSGRDKDISSLGLQMMWQMTPDSRKHQVALRADSRFSDALEQLSMRMAQQISFDSKWRSRFVMIGTAANLDTNHTTLNFSPRASLSRKIDANSRIGLELYGTVPLGTQTSKSVSSIGPFYSRAFGDKKDFAITSSLLMGLTSDERDVQLRVFLTKRL